MPINYATGKVGLSFEDLYDLAVLYQRIKIDLIPSLESQGQQERMERALEHFRGYWFEQKMITALQSCNFQTSDPIRWLNT
jgi:hypothetical protein